MPAWDPQAETLLLWDAVPEETTSPAPQITSGTSFTVNEGDPFTLALTGTQAGTWSLQPGLDGASFFLLGSDRLALPVQDFEALASATLRVVVRLTNAAGLYDEATISVRVLNVDDDPEPTPSEPSLDFSDPDNSQYVPLL